MDFVMKQALGGEYPTVPISRQRFHQVVAKTSRGGFCAHADDRPPAFLETITMLLCTAVTARCRHFYLTAVCLGPRSFI